MTRPTSTPTAASAAAADGALLGVGVLLIAGLFLGFTPIMVKYSEVGANATAFWRLVFALPALALLMRFETGGGFRPPRHMKAALIAGVFFAMDLAFWHTGIRLTTAANATLLANLTPVIVAVAAWRLYGERLNAGFLMAAALALFGAVMLSAANIQIAPERLVGDAFSAATSFWYAAYMLVLRYARRADSAARIMFWTTLAAAPIALALALLFGERIFPETVIGWAPLIALGMVIHVVGQGGLAFGLGRVPAALASLIILVQPLVAACAGWLLFSEALTPVQLAGGALVLIGVYVAQRFRAR